MKIYLHNYFNCLDDSNLHDVPEDKWNQFCSVNNQSCDSSLNKDEVVVFTRVDHEITLYVYQKQSHDVYLKIMIFWPS